MKNLKTLILLLFLFLSNIQSLYAQYFNKLVTLPYPYILSIYGITKATDNNYVLCFSAVNYGADTSMNLINIQKMSSDGNIIWTKSFGINEKKYFYVGLNINEVENENLLVTGFSQITDSATDKTYGFLLKLNKEGEKIWFKQYTNGSKICKISNTSKDLEGNYISCSYSQVYNEQTQKEGDVNAFVVKTDTSGKEIWQKTIGGSTFNEILTGIAETSDSNLLFVGRKYNGNGFDNIVVKLNKNGQLIWNKNFGVSQYDEAFTSIIKSKDNNFIICGVSGTSEPQNITDESSVLTKIDKDGNKIWNKRYTNETSNMTFEQVEELEDGSIVVVGQQDLKPYKAGITKFDKDGKVLWHRIIEYNKADKAAERINAFLRTKDNGFILGGTALPINTSPTNYQAWVVKLDSLGCDYAGCAKSTSTAEVEDEKEMFRIFPNPAQSEITITLQNDDESTMSIYSLSGAIVKQEVCTNKINTIGISTIENGMYLVVIQNKQGISTQKLIINR